MNIERVSPEAAVADWHYIGAVLKPAIERSRKDQLYVLRGIAVTGRYQLWRVRSREMGGYVVTMVGVDPGEPRTCWLAFAAGQVDPPVVANMRRLLAEFETMARDDGCEAMRVLGRTGWARVLTDYDRLGRDGRNTIYGKVL